MASVGSSRPLGLHSLTPLQPPARDPAEDPLPRLAPPSRCCRPARSRLRRPPSSSKPVAGCERGNVSSQPIDCEHRRSPSWSSAPSSRWRRARSPSPSARSCPEPRRRRRRPASPARRGVARSGHTPTNSPALRTPMASGDARLCLPLRHSRHLQRRARHRLLLRARAKGPYLPISPHISPYLLLRARAKGPQPCCCDVALPPQCHCYSPRRRAAPVLGRITILTRRRLPLVTCLNLRLSPRADRRPRRRHPLPQQARRLPARPRLRCLPAARASLTPLAVGAGFPLLLVSAAVYQLSSPASAIAVSTNLERATQFASLTLRPPPTPRPFPDPSPRTLSVAASRSSPAPWCSPAERCRARGGHLPPRACAGQAAPRAQRPRSVLLCSCSLLLLQARRRSELDGDAPAGGRAGGALQRCWSTATLSLL